MKNEIRRCICVDMSVDGQGIARSQDLVVFVKGMIKGEEADVRIIKEKRNYSIGIIDKLIKASSNRVASDCPIAYKCGGCDFRHIRYPYQLELKKEILQNTFRGFAVEDILPAGNPCYYRNKVQIPVRDHKMGFYRKNSNDIVVFDDCLLESEKANELISELKERLKDTPQEASLRHILIKHARGTGEIMLAFIVRNLQADFSQITKDMTANHPDIRSVILNLNEKDTNVILGEKEMLLYGRDHIFDIYDGIRVKLSLKSFYQVNYEQMLKLYEKVREKSGVMENSRVLDLYCGIGTISLYLARYAKHVTGVEIVPQAVENARDNALLNGMDNVDFVLADASRNMDAYIRDKDIVIVDPPRKGLGRDLIASLISVRAPKIVYISCNPATLARDLQLFVNDYEISAIEPVDMFPFTVHCECVVSLSLKES